LAVYRAEALLVGHLLRGSLAAEARQIMALLLVDRAEDARHRPVLLGGRPAMFSCKYIQRRVRQAVVTAQRERQKHNHPLYSMELAVAAAEDPLYHLVAMEVMQLDTVAEEAEGAVAPMPAAAWSEATEETEQMV
jgi:hypothetical protein